MGRRERASKIATMEALVCPYWTWQVSSPDAGADGTSSSSSPLTLQKMEPKSPRSSEFALLNPLLFSKDVEKATEAAAATLPAIQTSMYLDIRSSSSSSSSSAASFKSISLLGSARQVEVYLGENAVYHSTIKGVVHENNPELFHINISSLSSSESTVRIKFLSLIDRRKVSFSLHELSVTAEFGGSSNSGSGLRLMPDMSPSSSTTKGNSVDMAFIAQAVCQLVDAKLAPIMIRLEAIEGSMLRHEKSIRMLMNTHSARSSASTSGASTSNSPSAENKMESGCRDGEIIAAGKDHTEEMESVDVAENSEDIQKLRNSAKIVRESAQKALELE